MNMELFRKAKSLMKEDLEEEYGENYGYVMELIKEEIARRRSPQDCRRPYQDGL